MYGFGRPGALYAAIFCRSLSEVEMRQKDFRYNR